MNKSNDHPITAAIRPIIAGSCRDKALLRIEEVSVDRQLTINVFAALDDYRVLIGRGGRTVCAVQRLLRRAGELSGLGIVQYHVETIQQGEGSGLHGFVFNKDFNEWDFSELFVKLCLVVGLDSKSVKIKSDPDLKLRVYVNVKNAADYDSIVDLNNMIYCYGYTQGRKISVIPVETK